MIQEPLSDYLVLHELIAEGATSRVYRGSLTRGTSFGSAGSTVAVKLFRRELEGTTRARFERELAIGMALSSSRLVRYFSYGDYRTFLGTFPFIVMEHIEGETLDNALRRATESEVSLAFQQCLEALEVLHSAGVVHRDLQPHNFLLARRGVVLLDFGVAKYLDQTGGTPEWEEIGTRRYWAPECVLTGCESSDAKTDVFMLASCFVHAVTGRFLFSRANRYPLLFKQLEAHAAATSIRIPELDLARKTIPFSAYRLLTGMLSGRPADRPTAGRCLDVLRDGPVRTTTDDYSSFDVVRFLWELGRYHDTDVLARVCDGSGSPISAGEMRSLGRMPDHMFCSLVGYFCHWGLLAHRRSGEPLYYRFPDEHDVRTDVEFVPQPVARAVGILMASRSGLLGQVVDARTSLERAAAEGRLRMVHARGLDWVTLDGTHIVFDRCVHETDWHRQVARHLGMVEDVVIEGPVVHNPLLAAYG